MNQIVLSITVVVTILLLGSIISHTASAQFQSGGIHKDGTWYPGEGLKHGDFFSYRICHIDYKECTAFNLEMWIKDDIQVGTETQWLTKVVVYDGNKRIVGDLHLSKISTEPTGSNDELDLYSRIFKSSIVWLSSFATSDTSLGAKGPEEFRAPSWGNISTIGGVQPSPQTIEIVTVPAGSWEAVVVGWRTGGYESKIWVVDDFPFPVRALTYTHVSEGIPPKEYEFELLYYNENVTEDPFEGITSNINQFEAAGCDVDPAKDVTIKKSTNNFQYQIHASYGPEDPVQGCEMYWLIKFLQSNDDMEFLNQVQYDFLVVDDDLNPVRSIATEEDRQFLYSPSGQALVTFPVKENPGTANYVIWVYGLAPQVIVPSEADDYLQLEVEIFPNDNTSVLQTGVIPKWIKTNAGWWAEDVLDDHSFLTGITYLIDNGVVRIPHISQGTSDTTDNSIPTWVKTNAGLWAEDVLDDYSFISGIQFLVEKGIITIDSSS